jgi:hypothetical protein
MMVLLETDGLVVGVPTADGLSEPDVTISRRSWDRIAYGAVTRPDPDV